MRKKLLLSRSGFEKPESREEAIMQNILGASNVLEPSESNIEEILKSILYNTPYTKEAEFEIEKILLAIKNNGTYDGEGESRDMKILIAILNDLDYTEEVESRIEELFIEWLHQRSSIKVLEGVPPLTFTSRGLPLINYLIEGNTVQNGTPTPTTPIYPSECGDLVDGNYILPIKTGSTTTPVYLGQVESTRKIKKYEFTGNESWVLTSSGYLYSADAISDYNNTITFNRKKSSMFSHYIATLNDINGSSLSNGYACLYCSNSSPNNYHEVYIRDERYPTAADFKTYLADQYANGTPVTIWYVLATETTGIVNEPIRKIGTYADTVSKAQAGVEIPTNNGTTVIDVDTTLKPSNVYIEYK